MGWRDQSTASRSRALGRPPVWWRGSRAQVARWLLALVLALGAAVLVADQRRDAADTVAGFGTRRSVVVARHDLEPGRVISAGDVASYDLPLVAIPSGAMSGDTVGRIVTAPIVAGEVMNQARLAPDGLSAIAGLVPPGARGISVPRPADGSGLAVQRGDVVDVVAAENTNTGEGPTLVARAAVVIEVNDAAVTLAVRADEVPGVAAAVGRGVPVLALAGPTSR